MKHLTLISLAFLLLACKEHNQVTQLKTAFELSNKKETATYEEAIAWWTELDEHSSKVKLLTFGNTDAGKPLHLALINYKENFNLQTLKERNRPLLLINNAIHPGEPDGVDASMLFARELLSSPELETVLQDVIIAIIPFYNVGGALNRNCCSRANQVGPSSYGFRGNARNLDLNRDFIKADSRNAQSFIELTTALNPDVYLETHVSNGADYSYTMTYLLSHPDKLMPSLKKGMKEYFEKPLQAAMQMEDDEMIPYVNIFQSIPDSGYTSFYDTPRYSTGYLGLKHTYAMLTETHMLKPFEQRVASTLRFIHHLARCTQSNAVEILASRRQAVQEASSMNRLTILHEIDTESPNELLFKGYEARFDTSTVTQQLQLHYDRTKSWTKVIKYYDRLLPVLEVDIPNAYLVPVGWHDVVDRLKWNGVQLRLIDQDTTLWITEYKFKDFETKNIPFEGHYLHSNTSVAAESKSKNLLKESYYLIPTNQDNRLFIVSTLEPEAPDSYFNWNFFDEILQQKEWFSSYVFEEEAAEMIKDPKHAEALSTFIAQNPNLKDDAFSKLYFLYKQSPHFEVDRYMTYPVFRLDETH